MEENIILDCVKKLCASYERAINSLMDVCNAKDRRIELLEEQVAMEAAKRETVEKELADAKDTISFLAELDEHAQEKAQKKIDQLEQENKELREKLAGVKRKNAFLSRTMTAAKVDCVEVAEHA